MFEGSVSKHKTPNKTEYSRTIRNCMFIFCRYFVPV